MKQMLFQQKAVRELVNKTIDLLQLSGDRKKLIFKAPTGAGKTVMASQMLERLTDELQSRSDLIVKQVAFIWIAPNKLHQQSYFKMKNFFTETKLLRPVMYEELDRADGIIHPGEVLFVNWESVNKENNVMVRDTEQSSSLYDITRRTREEAGLPIVVVIDEEHLFWSATADKSAKVLDGIKPKVEIRISATPKTHSDYQVTIPREAVIAEEMIKRKAIINPDLRTGFTDETELTYHLISTALKQRDRLAEAYKRLGVNINPLLLIQLPNDKSEAMTAEDTKIADTVRHYLKAIKQIDEDNGRLAIWLSKEKANLPGLERLDNMTEVLLFKQAIALGWDCPRAAVLLIFRKLTSETFTIQTVGRILRMPEQHYYTDELLNVGYVYTDIAKDKVQIVADEMDYLQKDVLQANRRENLVNVALTSSYSVYKSADRNRLGPDFRRILMQTFEREWLLTYQPMLFSFAEMEGEEPSEEDNSSADSHKAENIRRMKGKIRFDVKNVNIEIPVDLVFQNEEGTIYVGEKGKFARTSNELRGLYMDWCREMLGGRFEKAHSTGILANYLMEALEELFDIFETDAPKVVLYYANKPKFSELVTHALDEYTKRLSERQAQARKRSFAPYTWEVPPQRLYNDKTHHVMENVNDHALMPFVELNEASTPEQRFRDFLEANEKYIDWWYKNGDEGKQHYAIPYTAQRDGKEEQKLFYVDFIIRMKSGRVFLFDTKTEASDPDAPQKHNALLEYMASPENSSHHLSGGIIIEKNEVWYYSEQPISTTASTKGWKAFFPDQV